MKKLLILMMLGFIGYFYFIYSTNSFHYLKNLPSHSRVKCECEQLEPSIIFTTKKEKACHFLENEINKLVSSIGYQVQTAKYKKDWIDSLASLAKLTRDVGKKLTDSDYHYQIEEAIRIIIPEATDKLVAAECAMLLKLTVQVIKNEFIKK